MKKLKKASNNELRELRGLIYKIESLIDKDYCHINEFIENKFLIELAKHVKSIEKEVILREL